MDTSSHDPNLVDICPETRNHLQAADNTIAQSHKIPTPRVHLSCLYSLTVALHSSVVPSSLPSVAVGLHLPSALFNCSFPLGHFPLAFRSFPSWPLSRYYTRDHGSAPPLTIRPALTFSLCLPLLTGSDDHLDRVPLYTCFLCFSTLFSKSCKAKHCLNYHSPQLPATYRDSGGPVGTLATPDLAKRRKTAHAHSGFLVHTPSRPTRVHRHGAAPTHAGPSMSNPYVNTLLAQHLDSISRSRAISRNPFQPQPLPPDIEAAMLTDGGGVGSSLFAGPAAPAGMRPARASASLGAQHGPLHDVLGANTNSMRDRFGGGIGPSSQSRSGPAYEGQQTPPLGDGRTSPSDSFSAADNTMVGPTATPSATHKSKAKEQVMNSTLMFRYVLAGWPMIDKDKQEN